LNFFEILGWDSLETHIFNSASRSKVPAVSILNLDILLYVIVLYSTFFPVRPCISAKIKE
jgi:hypothetical protein